LYINRNIKYIRELRGLTQSQFAERLDLNRGNVASYEMNSIPPLEVLIKITDLYKISMDALIKSDLSKSMSEYSEVTSLNTGKSEIGARLMEVVQYLGKSDEEIANELNTSIDNLKRIFKDGSHLDLEILMTISEKYSFLSLEWLLRGKGPMIGSTAVQLRKVAEPDLQDYLSNLELSSLEKLLGRILKRKDHLENKD